MASWAFTAQRLRNSCRRSNRSVGRSANACPPWIPSMKTTRGFFHLGVNFYLGLIVRSEVGEVWWRVHRHNAFGVIFIPLQCAFCLIARPSNLQFLTTMTERQIRRLIHSILPVLSFSCILDYFNLDELRWLAQQFAANGFLFRGKYLYIASIISLSRQRLKIKPVFDSYI